MRTEQLRRFPLFPPLALLVIITVWPTVGTTSAMGTALWSRVEFSAPTNLGVFHVKLGSVQVDGKRRLAQVEIEVDGRALRWPENVDLRVIEPQLEHVELTITRSITCIDDTCPDISGYPVFLTLTYGENPANAGDDVCGFSKLMFRFSPKGVEEINMLTCKDAKNEDRVLYQRK